MNPAEMRPVDAPVSAAVAAAAQLSTATISDALDRLGIAGQAFGIARISGDRVIAGPAFTVHYEPVGTDGGTVGDYIDDVDPGSVIVLANAGRLDVTVWGGLLSQVGAQRGIAGTVIDGVCRDVAGARALGYPLFAVGNWMRTGKDRVRAESMQVPVSVSGVRVRPFDLVVGDVDGVVVVPSECAEEAIDLAKEIDRVERAISDGVARGGRLDEQRRTGGYFELQRRTNRDDSVTK